MKFVLSFALIFSFAFVLVGCGASQVKQLAEQNITSAVCEPACAQQTEFDQKMCVSVCENVADTSQKVLADPSFEGVFDIVCDQACAQQSVVAPEVCLPVCNFLANSGKKLL